MDRTTERIAEYCDRLDFASLPASAIHSCKRHVIDTLAAALMARRAPVFDMMTKLARRQTSSAPATVWGSAVRTTPELAAFCNGTLLRFLDINDTYVGKSRGHPSDVISAVFAMSESVGASGRDAMLALVIAYDLYCSFIDAVEINKRGFDQPVYGVIACAAAAAKLLNLNEQGIGHAVALALAPNVALAQTRSGELSMWKNCAGANAARNGLFAAILAGDGFTGPSAVFEGVGGLWDVTGRFEWPLPEPGTPHRITRTHLKANPLCFHGQSAMEAALALREEVPPEQVRSIHVETYETAILMMANDPSRWHPTTRATADHSLPFAIASVWLDGQLASESFSDECLRNPAKIDFMKKVHVSRSAELESAYPQASPARITVTLADGRLRAKRIDHQRGHFMNPLADAEIEAKLRTALQPLPTAKVDDLIDVLWNLEHLTDFRAQLFARLDLGH